MSITVQNSYDFSQKPVGPGVLDAGENRTVVSRTVDAAGVSFGRACFSIADGRVSAVAAGADGRSSGTFLGVAMSDAGEASWMDAIPSSDIYAGLSNVSVLTTGTIWITAGSTVSADAPAYVTPAGAFTGVATGNAAIRGSFVGAAAAGTLVRLRLV